jgi:hypothetical protein
VLFSFWFFEYLRPYRKAIRALALKSRSLAAVIFIGKKKLGWVPEITVEEMCAEMVKHDLDKAKQHALLKKHGFDVALAKVS